MVIWVLSRKLAVISDLKRISKFRKRSSMAQAPRASFSEPDKIFNENFVLFEIRAIRAVVRVVTRIL